MFESLLCRMRAAAAMISLSTVTHPGLPPPSASAAPTRDPSRLAYWRVSLWSITNPNSRVPSTMSRRTGRIMPSRGSPWPRSLARCLREGAEPAAAHNTGSMRMTLAWVSVNPGPPRVIILAMGVIQL